jgi:hypothetical protein
MKNNMKREALVVPGVVDLTLSGLTCSDIRVYCKAKLQDILNIKHGRDIY